MDGTPKLELIQEGQELFNESDLLTSLTRQLEIVMNLTESNLSASSLLIARALARKITAKINSLVKSSSLEIEIDETLPTIHEIREAFRDYCVTLTDLKRPEASYNLIYNVYIPEEWKITWKQTGNLDGDFPVNLAQAIIYVDHCIKYIDNLKSKPGRPELFDYNSNWTHVFRDKDHAKGTLENFKSYMVEHFFTSEVSEQ
ncbi:MAG: hypothetical protein ACMG57_03040 [Candidatus Dojkabacteria bacterium]